MTGLSNTSCQSCRDKKVKCNRELPKCERCTRLKVCCLYREKLRTGPKRRKLPIDIIEQQETPFKATIHYCKSNISKKRQAVLMSNLNLFEILPLPIWNKLLDRFLGSRTGLESLGLTRDYLLKLASNYHFLLVSGVLAFSCNIHLDFKNYEHNLKKCFEYQFTLLNPNTPADTATDETVILELLQANAVNIYLSFLRFKQALVRVQLSESSEILQVYNYTMIDLVTDTIDESKDHQLMQMKAYKRKVYWTLYFIDKVCAIAMGLTSKIQAKDHYVDLPDSRLKFRDALVVFDEEDVEGELSLADYQVLLLSKTEDVLLWCRKLTYLKKSNSALKKKKLVMKEYQKFEDQLQRFEKRMKEDLDGQTDTFEYFAELGLLLVGVKAILSQMIVELYPCSESESTSLTDKLKAGIIELLLSIKDLIHSERIEFYQSHPFLVFFMYQYLKVSATYTEDEAILEINSMFLDIAAELVSRYENAMAMEVEKNYSKNKQSELSSWIFHIN